MLAGGHPAWTPDGAQRKCEPGQEGTSGQSSWDLQVTPWAHWDRAAGLGHTENEPGAGPTMAEQSLYCARRMVGERQREEQTDRYTDRPTTRTNTTMTGVVSAGLWRR